MDIVCTLSNDRYFIGETAVLLLKGSVSTDLFDNAIIISQVHGHVHADSRWTKIDPKFHEFLKSSKTELSPDNLTSVPTNPNTSHEHSSSVSYCSFATSRVTLSPTHLFDSGVLLEFEIPSNCFPTFKGLAGGVSYYLTITLQSPSELKQIHYPLVFNGGVPAGSGVATGEESNSTIYQTRFSSLVSYPVNSLPPESYFDSNNNNNNSATHSDDRNMGDSVDGDYYDNVWSDRTTSHHTAYVPHGHKTMQGYRINNDNNDDGDDDSIYNSGGGNNRNTEKEGEDNNNNRRKTSNKFICNLHVQRDIIPLGIGGISNKAPSTPEVVLVADFSETTEECLAMRASVLLCERRADGSRLQDRVLATVTKCTIDAELLNIVLSLPRDVVCNFDCPVFNISYRLDVEFCIEEPTTTTTAGADSAAGSGSGNTAAAADDQVGLFDNAKRFELPLTFIGGRVGCGGGGVDEGEDIERRSRNGGSQSALQQAHLCLESNVRSYPLSFVSKQ